MATPAHVANVPQIEDEVPADQRLAAILKRAVETKSPPPAWYRTMGHNPEVASAFAEYWELLHRGGTVPHEIKELCRIQIAQMIGCEFCASQVSPLAMIDDEVKESCALPDWDHPDPRTAAALHYARTLTLDDGRDEEVYAELREHFTEAEIIEMAAFFCLTAGGNRMAKSWGITPETGDVIPAGAMNIHSGF